MIHIKTSVVTCFLYAILILVPSSFAKENQGKELYPLGLQLKVLEKDLSNSEYHEVLNTMIFTDLRAEWKRVGTPDNYVTFLKKYGGLEKVSASAELKSAYERRKNIADRFLKIINKKYSQLMKKPLYQEKDLKELLENASDVKKVDQAEQAVSIEVIYPSENAKSNWPRLRGPSGQGNTFETDIPLHWDDQENVIWKSPISGHGNSSPVVWDDRIFITAASEDGKQRSLICYARSDGSELWTGSVPNKFKKEKLYWKNTYASSTVVTDGTHVVCLFGSAGLVCFDFDGNKLWNLDLGEMKIMHGPGTTPAIYKNTVIVMQDQNPGDSLFAAYNIKTGKEVWKKFREKSFCWSSPVFARVGDHDELIYNGSHYIIGYDPQTGNEIWRCHGSTRESIPMIVVGGGLIYSVSGRNGPALAIRPGGKGDITKTHIAWKTQRGAPHVPSPLYHNGRLYFVNDTGIATCLDATNGKTIWQKRVRGRFSMSPILINKKILVTNEKGKSYIFKTGDQFKVLAENDLKETIYATPAILGGKLYFRTNENLICIGTR
jgi:outer membrane protein assembly factor BamB